MGSAVAALMMRTLRSQMVPRQAISMSWNHTLSTLRKDQVREIFPLASFCLTAV
jgi:hypothetical protein